MPARYLLAHNIVTRHRKRAELLEKHQAIYGKDSFPSTIRERRLQGKTQNRPSYWTYVDKRPNGKGCWIWTGPKSNGYGMWKGKPAHRYHFPDITSKDFVCHHCDNKACVNPDHLYIGSGKTNAQDRYKSTNIFGEIRHEQFLERNVSF